MSGPIPAAAKALEGLDRSETKLREAAERISQATSPGEPASDEVSLSEAMVDLIRARNSYAANVRALHTADQMQGMLIDVLG